VDSLVVLLGIQELNYDLLTLFLRYLQFNIKKNVAEYQIIFLEMNIFLACSEHKTHYLFGLVGSIDILLLIPVE